MISSIRYKSPSNIDLKGKNGRIYSFWCYNFEGNLDKSANKKSTLAIVKINAFFSKWVDHITYNSNRALEVHQSIGYKNMNYSIIANGFELDKFCFNASKRNMLREKLSIANNIKVIITVGRWNVQKDYNTLLKALSLVLKNRKDFIMIMVGTNLDNNNLDLIKLKREFHLANNLLLLGRRDDIPDLLSLSDIYISSSIGESFSNSIGEAMACELPCVVTNVGDSKILVGDTGYVIKPGDYKGLEHKIFNLLENNSIERCPRARERILKNYEINEIVRQIEKIF